MSNVIQLSTRGNVTTKDDRQFTRLVGGFGDDKPIFTIWQAAELLGLSTREVTQNYERNLENFESNLDVLDLKSAVTENDSNRPVEITKFLKENGYSQNKLNATKQWLAFSFSGMMKLVKIATTKESWEIYNNFLEDYFQTKAENQTMKKTIKEQLQELREEKAKLYGMAIVDENEMKRFELLRTVEKISDSITELEKIIVKEETIEVLRPKIQIANTVTETDSCYDVGSFSKILGLKGLGRNNMFAWLRDKKILMSNNDPYQTHTKYFKVVPVENPYTGGTNNKTLVRANGIEYIVKKLIDDGKIITKSIEEIINELEKAA